MKSLHVVVMFILGAVVVSCGLENTSQTKADKVLVKLPFWLSQKFETSDVIAFSEGEEGTNFGKRIDQLDGLPGVEVDKQDVIESLTDEIVLNSEAIKNADQSKEGRKLLKDFSEYVYSEDKKGEISDSLVALKAAGADGVGSILELIKVWPSKRVDVDILKVLNNEDDFQKILDGLNNLNQD
jgi:hypothetical protein